MHTQMAKCICMRIVILTGKVINKGGERSPFGYAVCMIVSPSDCISKTQSTVTASFMDGYYVACFVAYVWIRYRPKAVQVYS